MLYTVQVTITRDIEDRGVSWRTAVYTPQFMFDGDVLGITDIEHAEEIAVQMFERLGFERDDIDVYCLRVEEKR